MRFTCKYGATKSRILTYLRIVRLPRSGPAGARRLGLSVGRSGGRLRTEAQKLRRIQHPEGDRYESIRASSRRIGLPIIITRQEFIGWFLKQKPQCTYCDLLDLSLDSRQLYGGYPRAFTIDRKNSDLPYVIENMVMACWTCNRLKSDVFTFEEFREISQKYLKPKWQKKLELARAN